MSAERLSSTPRRHYSSYSDYASDLLDARHRSISGTMSGTYELYDEEVSGLTARHRPPSPMSVVYDVEPYHGFDPHKIRPIRSTDIKAKLKRSHTTRRWHAQEPWMNCLSVIFYIGAKDVQYFHLFIWFMCFYVYSLLLDLMVYRREERAFDESVVMKGKVMKNFISIYNV